VDASELKMRCLGKVGWELPVGMSPAERKTVTV
jgi:hypothetical protein